MTPLAYFRLLDLKVNKNVGESTSKEPRNTNQPKCMVKSLDNLCRISAAVESVDSYSNTKAPIMSTHEDFMHSLLSTTLNELNEVCALNLKLSLAGIDKPSRSLRDKLKTVYFDKVVPDCHEALTRKIVDGRSFVKVLSQSGLLHEVNTLELGCLSVISCRDIYKKFYPFPEVKHLRKCLATIAASLGRSTESVTCQILWKTFGLQYLPALITINKK